MAKRSGMYSSNKRKKEMQRQKKQEAKRLKREKNTDNTSEGPDEAAPSDPESSRPQNTD